MPIYEYVCTACGHDLEALQKISEEPLVYCPQCGDATLKKKISAAAFKLKGTGWYETDFKHGSKRKEDQSPAKKEKVGAENKTEKPADKAKSNGGTSKDSSAA